MITNVVSPFLSASTAPSGVQTKTAAPSAAPTDTAALGAAESTSGLGGMKKAAVALMMGATVLGGGLLTPGTASAHEFRGPQVGYSQPVHYGGGYGYGHGHHHGNDMGDAIAGGIIGGILGGVIGGVIGGAVPVPPMPPPPPPPGGYGYDGYGCDGIVHHFDNYGNVSDMSGHYRLQQGPYGQCYRTAPYPY